MLEDFVRLKNLLVEAEAEEAKNKINKYIIYGVSESIDSLAPSFALKLNNAYLLNPSLYKSKKKRKNEELF